MKRESNSDSFQSLLSQVVFSSSEGVIPLIFLSGVTSPVPLGNKVRHAGCEGHFPYSYPQVSGSIPSTFILVGVVLLEDVKLVLI